MVAEVVNRFLRAKCSRPCLDTQHGCAMAHAAAVLSEKETTMPLQPRKEALDQPAPLIATQSTTVLCPTTLAAVAPDAARSSRCLPFAAPRQPVAVIRLVANQILRLRFDHVEVETQLHQRHFMMIGSVRANRQSKQSTLKTDFKGNQSVSLAPRPRFERGTFRLGGGRSIP